MQSTYRSPRIHHVVAIALALAMSCASASVFAGWFGKDTVKGNGVLKKQERALPRFTGVEVAMPAQVEVRIGATESVSIETDENILPLIATVVESGTLQLRTTKRDIDIDVRTLRIVVTAREIADLAVSGSGSITADTLRSPRLGLAIGGKGSINVKTVQSESVDTSIGGSGKVSIGGATRKLSVSIGGSGDVQARQLKADDVSVSIGGSGSATLWPVSSLSTAMAGSGDVNYYGDPKTSTSVVGSGSIKRLGASPQ